jgi:uncharacterized SAM-binding protein YcdF (DUF218 family)
MPLPLFVILFLVGVFYLHKSHIKKAKVILSLSFLWLFLISYPPLVNTLLYAYETSYKTLETAPKEVKYIYVLGGGHHSDKALPITSQINAAAVVRLNEGIRLFRQLKEKPMLIVSGFSTLYDNTPHAILQEKLALSLGVPKEKLHLEPRVQDTQEEAVAAKKYIKDAPFILVTSASHMPRAMRFFNHVGLTPIAAPTNHLAHVAQPNYFAFFAVGALKKSRILWHELLGRVWQKVKGI